MTIHYFTDLLSLRIALRYLFSKKSHRAVNIISAISIAGVAVATMAIVVVLSVFNGFTRLSEAHLSRIDPDLKIISTEGKTFAAADSLAAIITTLPGVGNAMPVIEERGMLISDQGRIPVRFKAVPDDYNTVVSIDSVMIDGAFTSSFDSVACAQISVGVAYRTGLRPSLTTVADLYVPRRKGRINPANPSSAFRSLPVMISGVMQVDQADVDNDLMIVPLADARNMLNYTDEATAIELSVSHQSSSSEVSESVQAAIGPDFTILDRHMQQADAYRMIRIEKWVTFMMLVFILVIASFNILSTLSLLVIEKRKDSAIFRAMGMTRRRLHAIFATQGFLITVAGGIGGIIIGIILSLLQQHFGLIRLAGDPAALTISVYPVAVEATDILAVLGAIVVLAIICSMITIVFTKSLFKNQR